MDAKGTDGTVSFDGEWLAIRRSGFMALTKGGRGETRLNVSQISGIDIKAPGLTAGRFQVLAAGAVQRGAGLRASRSDPLTVMFQKGDAAAFSALRAEVEQAIAARSAPPPPAVPAGVDLAGQLQRLAVLRTEGAISEAEYAAAKAKLLGQ